MGKTDANQDLTLETQEYIFGDAVFLSCAEMQQPDRHEDARATGGEGEQPRRPGGFL